MLDSVNTRLISAFTVELRMEKNTMAGQKKCTYTYSMEFKLTFNAQSQVKTQDQKAKLHHRDRLTLHMNKIRSSYECYE